MRIAISAEDERGLDAAVSPHFGRCPHYALVDVEGHEVKAVRTVANPFYGNHQPGQVPGFIRQQGANVMLTGGMGSRAVAFFEQYGIVPVTGAMGTVGQALEQYLQGDLQGAAPCHESVKHGDGQTADEHEDDEAEQLGRKLDDAAGGPRGLKPA